MFHRGQGLNSVTQETETAGSGFVELKDGRKVSVVNALLSNKVKSLVSNVPVVEGKIGGKRVTVLRDTGSNTIVLRKKLIPKSALTGEMGLVFLVDGTAKQLPEEKVKIATPFFKGKIVAKLMEDPLYDVILGKVPGVRAANDPDPEWEENDEPTDSNAAAEMH